MIRVRLTNQARADLIQIWHFIDQTGAQVLTADRVLLRLDNRIRKLVDFPHRGIPRPDIRDDMRMLVIERWLVFYRILPDVISIIRIIDGARDLTRVALDADDDS